MATDIKLYVGNETYKTVGNPGMYLQLVPFQLDEAVQATANISNIVVDPIYLCPMLKSEQESDLYNISTIGNLARLRKTDFNLNTANWEEIEYGFSGNWFILSKNDTSEIITTTTSRMMGTNRGFLLKFFVFPSSFKNNQILNFQFGQYQLEVYKNGWTRLFKNGEYVGDGYITGGFERNTQKPYDFSVNSGTMVDLYIVPIRRNTVEIYSNIGGGWAYEDESLDTSIQNTIIESSPASIQFTNTKGFFQLFPLTYPVSGSFYTYKTVPYVPTIEFISSYVADKPGGSVVELDTSPSYTEYADSEAANMCFRVDLYSSQDSKYTPILYNVFYNWGSTVSTVSHIGKELTKWRANSLELTLDSEPDARNLNWIIDEEETITSLEGKCNRSIHLFKGDEEIFVGLTNMPTKTDPPLYELQCNASDLWKKLDRSQLSKNLVGDNRIHTELIKELVLSAGIPEDRIFIWPDTFRLPCSNRRDTNAIEFDAGSSRAEAIKYIKDTFVFNWVVGFQPVNGKVCFVYAPLSAFPTTPVKKFYDEITDEHDRSNVYFREGFKESYIEPEATFVRVIGLDEYERMIIKEAVDSQAENADLTESLRPDNWVGERRYVGYYDTSLATDQAVAKALEIYFNKLTVRRKLIEFTSIWDHNLWPQYLVELDKLGVFRLKSVKINFEYLNDYGDEITATYMGELYIPGVN